ncbi:MAG: hypothetical protein AB7T14_06155 [Candidatus Methylacidiphilaceae bacterium]
MPPVWSRKRLWILGGTSLLAVALVVIFSGMFRTKPMITDARVREIFAGKDSAMTVEEFFAWVDWMRQKRPMSLEATEALLGVRLRRLKPSEDFLRTDAKFLKWQGPNYLENLDREGRNEQIGIAEWASGPWKEINFFRYRPSDDCPAIIEFSLRPEVIRISKGEMVRHLGAPGVHWNPPVENFGEGEERFPQGLVPNLYFYVYKRPRDDLECFFKDRNAHDVLHDELPLQGGRFEFRLKPEAKGW